MPLWFLIASLVLSSAQRTHSLSFGKVGESRVKACIHDRRDALFNIARISTVGSLVVTSPLIASADDSSSLPAVEVVVSGDARQVNNFSS